MLNEQIRRSLEADARDFKLGFSLHSLAYDHAIWAQKNFGTDEERGPIGPLKHLAKEALEAAADPTDKVEYADCLLILLDASRRAGISPIELVELAQEKMKVNLTRTWPKPEPDMPVEHVK